MKESATVEFVRPDVVLFLDSPVVVPASVVCTEETPVVAMATDIVKFKIEMSEFRTRISPDQNTQLMYNQCNTLKQHAIINKVHCVTRIARLA